MHKKVVSVEEAHERFPDLARQVAEEETTVVVEHLGVPHLVVLSPREYARLGGRLSEPDDWIAALDRLHASIREERGDRELPDLSDLFHEMREERDAQLLDGLR